VAAASAHSRAAPSGALLEAAPDVAELAVTTAGSASATAASAVAGDNAGAFSGAAPQLISSFQ
jgi:hypothetical protein